ncbi:MAG: transposase [Cocleimonas sp.]|nr:transposase [Cocleimonas sp.]
MDNASVHKVDNVKQLLEKSEASIVFLPPYSPDLNPIELAWNKIKTYLRKKRARTADELYAVYALMT